MKSLKKYIDKYNEYTSKIDVLEELIAEKRRSFENSIKKDKEKLMKLTKEKNELNKEIVENKVVSISLNKLIKELSKLTSSDEFDISLTIETNAMYYGPRKKTLKQMLKEINEDPAANLIVCIEKLKGNCPFEFNLVTKLDIFADLENGEKLANYFYTEKSDVRDGECLTSLHIKEKAWDKIMYNFSLKEMLNQEDEKYNKPVKLLQNAIFNCMKKEKTNELVK